MGDGASTLTGLKNKAKEASIADHRVRDFMSPNSVSVPDGSKIYIAIQMLESHKVGSAPVVDRRGRVVGVVSEHDLLMQTATKDVLEPIEYNKEVTVFTEETTLLDALVTMFKKKLRRVPVVSPHSTVIGTVTRMDVLRELIGKGKNKMSGGSLARDSRQLQKKGTNK